MASQPTSSMPAHLSPSPLGTKEYWDTLYSAEITNHKQDPSDIGTIWFSDSSAEEKVLAFLLSPKLGLDREKCSFLDLGTGNGSFLFRLRGGDDDEEEGEEDEVEEKGAGTGFRGRMLGVDYSEKSVVFARDIAEEKGYGDGSPGWVEFRHWDIMNDDPRAVLDGGAEAGWDVVLDKGTFDAISLSDERDGAGRRVYEGYTERVERLVRNGGLFLVTSCNWTEDELKGWFQGGSFVTEGSVKYGSFVFGGRKGQTVSSVCFRKVG